VALEVGIVGLPGARTTALFNALTHAGAQAHERKEHVGMAPIADERLPKVAAVEQARKVTPAVIRVVDVPGTGPQLLGNLRQVDALLLVVREAVDVEELRLELLVADRDHVERRLERVRQQAKSGDPQLRQEVVELERLLAHVEGGGSIADYPDRLPSELDPLTTKPLVVVENATGTVPGPDRAQFLQIDLDLEAELSELDEEEAAAFRDGGRSALDEVAVRLKEALDLVTFFTASDKETRAWTLRRGQTALDAAATIHSDIARGFIRCEVIRWGDLVECGSRAEVSKRGLQRLEGKEYVVEDGDVLNIRFSPPR
jgi:ribosome-binding ATPase YchF (GTP1/OBG family)